MKIEVQAAMVLYEKRWNALKDRFGDVYSNMLNANKGNISKTQEQLLDYASKLVQDFKDAKTHLNEVGEKHDKEKLIQEQEQP